jgi:hypothetical protein
MAHSFNQSELQELVLFQAVMRRKSKSAYTLAPRKTPRYPVGPSPNPRIVNSGVKQIAEKLKRQTFYHNHWWSASNADIGLIINLFA